MRLKRLEKLKKEHVELSGEIDSLKEYLKDLVSKRVKTVAPRIVSQKLDIPYGDAVFLLRLAEKDKVLRKSYQVFTINDNFFLGEYDDSSDIPKSIENPATGLKVARDNFVIDLVFHFIH